MRRRRGVSFGTVAMIIFAVLVLLSTYFVMSGIRKDEGDLSMDAEILLDSVGELLAVSHRHINENLQATTSPLTASASGIPATVVASPAPTQTRQAVIMPAVPVTPQPTISPVPNNTFTMTFGGSIMLESSVIAGTLDKKTEIYRYDGIMEGIAPAIHADMNFAIVETLFSSESIANKDLVAAPETISAISATGFDTAILCGQNAISAGVNCAGETLAAFRSAGMNTSGLYLPENPARFDMVSINGVKVALLTYTDGIASTGKKLVSDPKTRDAMIHTFTENAVREDITAARGQGAQAVIVFLHTETNDATEPSAAQKKNAQAIANAGADILIGFGGRNVQHVEMIPSAADPSHSMLSAWSLGMLVCEDRDTRGVVSGALLHLQTTFDNATGKLRLDSVEYTPTYCWRQEENGIYPFRVIQSNKSVPEGMIQKQREIVARSLVLIQNTMKKGIAVQR